MAYLVTKNLHITLAVLSLCFFLIRAIYPVRDSPLLERRWIKVLPHVVDTLLLICGLTLMTLLKAWPHQTPWLTAKLIALLLYIGAGTIALKRDRPPCVRILFTLLALLIFGYMVAVATTKTAVPFAY